MSKKDYLLMLQEAHEAELQELKEEYGIPNVMDFYYSSHRGTWILKFHVGEDDEFDTKQEMIEWIKYDANNQE